MPNQRDPEQAVTSFAAPRSLLVEARAKAASEGLSLSDVLRAALGEYVGEREAPRPSPARVTDGA